MEPRNWNQNWLYDNWHRTEKGKKSCNGFQYIGPKLWNFLPAHIRKTTIKNIFKAKLKDFIWENVPSIWSSRQDVEFQRRSESYRKEVWILGNECGIMFQWRIWWLRYYRLNPYRRRVWWLDYVITAWILKLSQYIVLWMKVNILLLLLFRDVGWAMSMIISFHI